MRFQLADEDVKHYGLPPGEWIHFDINRFTNREADLVERPEPAGPGLSPEDWLECLRGDPVEVKGVPKLDDKTGEQVRAPSRRTISIMFWLGVRRAGVEVAWADWEYDAMGFVARRDDQPDDLGEEIGNLNEPDEVDDMGKDPAGPLSPSDDGP